jgi:hypothetical protein
MRPPPPAAIIARAAAWPQKNTPLTFTASITSSSSSVVSTNEDP